MCPLHIVVAEDNPDDLACLQKVLGEAGLEFSLTVARDGEQARECLLKRGNYANVDDPDLVFLDMNMPRLTGVDVLRQVPGSQQMPICILSGSEWEREAVTKHFLPKRAPYLMKPFSFQKMLECFRSYERLRPLVAQLSHGT